jgi:hypothetical protein
MASLSTERNGRKLFSGDKEGPPLRHLKQMSAAQDVGIKLRPTATNLTPNDRFVLLTDLLEGGARSQADQLQERMQKELDANNAMELAEYEASLAMHPCKWQSGMPCPQKVGDRRPYLQHRHPRWLKHYIGIRWVSFGLCLAACILNGPPAALRSTETLNLCQGSQRPIW